LVSATIVFQASGTQKASFSTNEIVIFTNATLNTGSGYNSGTGKFTAPIAGLYLFVKQICGNPNSYLFTEFVHNNTPMLESIVGYTNWQCGSTQAYMQLVRGDTVWVKITSSSSYIYSYRAEGTTFFSGALIHRS